MQDVDILQSTQNHSLWDFYSKHGFKLVEESRKKEYPVLYLNMQPIIEELEPTESLEPYIEDKTE